MPRHSRARGAVGRWGSAWLYAIGSTTSVVLAVLAARADSEVPGTSPWRIALDVAVGLSFIVAGAIAPGHALARGLLAAVGASWLIGSFAHDAALVHQALLVLVLLGFPNGRPRGVIRWLLVAFAVPVGLLLVSQLGVSALFAAVAATALIWSGRDRVAMWYAVGAATGVSLTLAASWSATRWDVRSFDPSARLLTYELILLSIAMTYPIASRKVITDRARLTDEVLSDTGLAGLDGLAAVLREVLRDPELQLYRWLGPDVGYGNINDGRALESTDRHVLYVDDRTGPLGAVVHRSAALEDAPTAAAVASAVRLAVVHQQLQEELTAQLDELGAARMRLLAAADRQRVATAVRLRTDVVGPLERTVSELHGITTTAPDGVAAEAVGVVVQELTAAAGEVVAVVGGFPPAVLGDNRLRAAVEALAHRSPVAVTVRASPAAAADAEIETALFYVCSEALTNAVKHAGAKRIDVAIDGTEREVGVTVTDDGCGGADATGSGLQGLADRLAARRGRLRVVSPPGAGTTVTATIPR